MGSDMIKQVDKLPESTRMVGRLNNRSNERYVNEQEGIGEAVKRVGQSIGVSGEGVCHGEISVRFQLLWYFSVLYSQGEGKKNVVYPLDTYQEMKNTFY